ncbi:ABC transporter ATP-binding protein [Clostridium sp. B9]
MDNYIVETKSLSKNFKNFKALDNIELRVEEGKIYGFLGPNGAGKSTTLKILLGLVKATEGQVKVLGMDIKEDREKILKNIGALIESPSYYGHLTAYENMEIIRRVLKLEKTYIDDVLRTVGLLEVKNKKVREFSLGMRQRLGIAEALIGNPKLLILDEPTNGLDPAGILEIRELIKSLPSKGITVIISSHILSEIELIADNVGVINKGKLIYQGTLDSLRAKGSENILLGLEDFEANKESVTKLLTDEGYSVNCEEDKFVILGNKKTASKICRIIILKGYDVNYLSYKRNSLEDIFLSLTKEEDL